MFTKLSQISLGLLLGLSIFFLLAWLVFTMPTIPFGAMCIILVYVLCRIGRAR